MKQEVTESESDLRPQTTPYKPHHSLLLRGILHSHHSNTTPTCARPQQESSPVHPSHPAQSPCPSTLDLIL